MIVKTNDIHYKNIAKTMANRSDAGASLLRREYPDGILPSEMPDLIAEIVSLEYQSGYYFGKEDGRHLGYNEGKTDGIAEGVDIGRKAEYDEFWDAFQNNGKRYNYQYAFANEGWNDTTFAPKYDIVLGNGYTGSNMFQLTAITNITEALERHGVILDTSKCGVFSSMFHSAKSVRLPVLDFSSTHEYASANPLSYTFYSCLAETIDKIVINEQTLFANTTFNGCANLKNIVFEGTLGQNGLNLQWSTKLSAASLESIINALTDTTRYLTVTLSLAAVNKAFETAEGANDGSDSVSWRFLRGSKPYWNIALV